MFSTQFPLLSVQAAALYMSCTTQKNEARTYAKTSAGLEAMRRGRIAGFMTDLSIAGVICTQSGNEDLQVIPVPHELFSGALGAISILEKFCVYSF